jgi:hypothetical protein
MVAAAATVIGGAAAGAVGVALNEGLEKGFDQICATDVLKGAGLGALAALPFAVLPFLPAVATGVAGFAVAGGASGAIGYASDVASGHAALSFWEAAKYIGLGALTAGVFRFAAGRFSAWRSAKTGYPKATPESDASAQKVVDELNNPENQFNASQKRRMVVALDHGDGTSTVGISGNPDKTAPIIERLQPKVGDKIKLVPANPDAPLQPAPDPRSPGAVYPGGKVCAEPGAFTGAEGKPVKGMTTQWAGEAGRNPQPVSPGSQYANPCPSCDHNKGTIMNLGKPSPAAGAAAAGAQTTGRDGGGSEGQ